MMKVMFSDAEPYQSIHSDSIELNAEMSYAHIEEEIKILVLRLNWIVLKNGGKIYTFVNKKGAKAPFNQSRKILIFP